MLIGPIVMLYDGREGVTIGVLLALIAAVTAIPLVWREIEWGRVGWLIWPGLVTAPLGALVVRELPDAALLCWSRRSRSSRFSPGICRCSRVG